MFMAGFRAKPSYIRLKLTVKGGNMKVEAVLFDLFDTLLLVNPEFYMPSLRKLHRYLAEHEVNASFEDFTRAYFEVRDRLYEETIESLEEPHFTTRISQTLQKLGYNSVSEDIISEAATVFSEEMTRYISLDKETVSTLTALHGKYKLGVITNSPFPENVRNALDKFHLKMFFDTVIISGEVNKRKPSKEIFKKALKTLNIDPSRTVFIGDTPNADIIGAKNVGIKAILIKRSSPISNNYASLVWREPDGNIRPEPDTVISHLSQLPNILEKS